MRNRSAVVIIQNGQVALIKRVKNNEVYYVFPGGGIEPGETPEEAAKREAFEELGVEVSVGRCISEVNYEGTQYFFEADITDGLFRNGQGEELTDTTRNRGTYLPVWVEIGLLADLNIKPKEVVLKILAAKNDLQELELTGGNISKVVRSGNTVRREMKEGSERIHKLLLHLEAKGYPYSPQFLGIDEQGREILTFIDGEAGNYPAKSYMWSDENLRKIAAMLRDYHEAVSDFAFDESWTSLPRAPEGREVICHNDFAIYNLIFRDSEVCGVIDFDVAAPGPVSWDVAYTLYTCVPLSRFYLAESGEKIKTDSAEQLRRIEVFLKAYGKEFGNILDVVIRRLEALCQLITEKAEAGDPAFRKMQVEGHIEHYREDILYIRELKADETFRNK
ncbi:aminoglycoside phosphotransferase [Jeotgalibacillus malaysiensis]|uniref:Aminoglycoside phosphotransferase n=1 Tax=Jeotgalibacillus malaysiensis TaxID=1508404 RepID=A0A0B5ALV7_9BACL|nr:aminoglycoside phosphotransferase [Jeotgalibacillus malaysiensis]